MSETLEKILNLPDNSSDSRLNTMIAITVAIAATLVAVFNIKDNNIVQAMSQSQAHAIDAWSYYQAKSIKQNLAENALENLQLRLVTDHSLTSKATQEIQKLVENQKIKVEKYDKEKQDLKLKAEGFQQEYDGLNLHDDQFDLAEALISLGLSILGITALTKNWPLFYFGLGFCILGAFFGFAGFLGLAVHPEWLTGILA